MWCLATLMIGVILFQIFFTHIWEIFYRNFERFIKNALTQANFELEKYFFFKWDRISPEIDWYHYQGASVAPMCIVQHQTMKKNHTRWSVQCAPPPIRKIKIFLNFRIIWKMLTPSRISFRLLWIWDILTPKDPLGQTPEKGYLGIFTLKRVKLLF